MSQVDLTSSSLSPTGKSPTIKTPTGILADSSELKNAGTLGGISQMETMYPPLRVIPGAVCGVRRGILVRCGFNGTGFRYWLLEIAVIAVLRTSLAVLDFAWRTGGPLEKRSDFWPWLIPPLNIPSAEALSQLLDNSIPSHKSATVYKVFFLNIFFQQKLP